MILPFGAVAAFMLAQVVVAPLAFIAFGALLGVALAFALESR